MLYKPWDPMVVQTQQPFYQPVVEFTYWSELGSFNDWNIIPFANKTISSEEFYDIHKVLLDGIIANTELLIHTGKYGAINSVDTTTIVYYVVK